MASAVPLFYLVASLTCFIILINTASTFSQKSVFFSKSCGGMFYDSAENFVGVEKICVVGRNNVSYAIRCSSQHGTRNVDYWHTGASAIHIFLGARGFLGD